MIYDCIMRPRMLRGQSTSGYTHVHTECASRPISGLAGLSKVKKEVLQNFTSSQF